MACHKIVHTRHDISITLTDPTTSPETIDEYQIFYFQLATDILSIFE